MNPVTVQLDELEQIFSAALERPPAERAPFVDQACGLRFTLRQEVFRLLEAHADSTGFLEQPLPQALADAVPEVQPARWHILECVGEGGLGVVYRACTEQDGVRREAALKVLRPGFDQGCFRDRFVRERQILAALDHPYITRILDGGRDENGRSYLVMEFVNGEPMASFVAGHKPSLQAKLALFGKICEAVQYLHSRLIVHGDIKPSNVMVTPEGIPKLLDFGTARYLTSDGGEFTRLLLTPQYASPERKRGEGPSIPSDVYSLGCLMQDLLGGLPCDRDLGAIRRRCLHEEPGGRYQSVADLLEDLRRYGEGMPVARARQR
jgi:serine/threonine-protein kinase